MTTMEFFEKIKMEILAEVTSVSPYRSGDLARSFELIEHDDGFSIRTTATEDFNYMQYVEDMAVHGKYGWVNYNYKWLQELAKVIAHRLAQHLGGTVYVR